MGNLTIWNAYLTSNKAGKSCSTINQPLLPPFKRHAHQQRTHIFSSRVKEEFVCLGLALAKKWVKWVVSMFSFKNMAI